MHAKSQRPRPNLSSNGFRPSHDPALAEKNKCLAVVLALMLTGLGAATAGCVPQNSASTTAAGPGCSCLSFGPSLLLLPAIGRRWRLIRRLLVQTLPGSPRFRQFPRLIRTCAGSRFPMGLQWAWVKFDRQHRWRSAAASPWPFRPRRVQMGSSMGWQVARLVKAAPVPSCA